VLAIDTKMAPLPATSMTTFVESAAIGRYAGEGDKGEAQEEPKKRAFAAGTSHRSKY
jgi:hypothetical protein